jgi:hypothetical protein
VREIRPTEAGRGRDLVVDGRGTLRNIDWSADGKGLLVTAADSAESISLLHVALDGQVSVLLEHTNSSIIAAIPSPDGHALAIDEFSFGPTTVWILDNL